MGGVDQTDLTKRGGRYTSDFIWNTKWKDQVRHAWEVDGEMENGDSCGN